MAISGTGRGARTVRKAPQPEDVAVGSHSHKRASRGVLATRYPEAAARSGSAALAALQGTAGNGAVARLLRSRHQAIPRGLQAKLMVGAANDPLEREADRVADEVMRRWASGWSPACTEDVGEVPIQRQADPGHDPASAFEPDAPVAHRLAARSGSGHALPAVVRNRMEAGLGADLSQVRIHRDAEASDLSTGLAARAFTHGTDIYFAAGAYDPGSRTGQHLLAHELAHVVQQAAVGDGHPSVRRKPADIDKVWKLDYDAAGKLLNVPAPRAKVKRAVVINAQVRDGWVNPREELTGGHLFKAEYGGPDDMTNVVPWRNVTEDAFTVFERGYEQAVAADVTKAAAKSTPFQAQVHARATFEDRPDLIVSDTDLDTAGWGPSDPGRAGRKDQFADVAEHFSGIPTSVSVQVLGITGAPMEFAVSKLQIAPAYTRNDEAVKPAYIAQPFPFQRHVMATRGWVPANWANQKDPVKVKLQHEWSHREHWGFGSGDNFSPKTTGRTFEERVKAHVLNMNHEQILGTYRSKTPVNHFVNETTRMWACTLVKGGTFFAGWKLSPDQLDRLLTQGDVR